MIWPTVVKGDSKTPFSIVGESGTSFPGLLHLLLICTL